MSDMVEDMVDVLLSCCKGRGEGVSPDEDVIVWERPGGGAAPKILENAASRWLLGAWPCPRRWS